MKTFIYSLLVVVFMVPAAFAQRDSLALGLQEKLQKATQESLSLAAVVQNEFKSYYGHTNFDSPEWKRAANFLSWVRQNDKLLLSSALKVNAKNLTLRDVLQSPDQEMKNVFWAFLGLKYLLSKENSPNSEVFDFSFCSGTECYITSGSCAVEVGTDPMPGVAYINRGIHEAAHVLNGCRGAHPLAEPAAIRAQNKWALPVKKGSTSVFDGSRDIRVAMNEPDYFKQEYMFFFLAPLLQDNAYSLKREYKDNTRFCDFLVEQLTPEWGINEVDEQGHLKMALGKWLGQSQADKLLAKTKAEQFVTVGHFSRQEVMKFYDFYYDISEGNLKELYMKDMSQQLAANESYWLYLSEGETLMAQFSQTPPVGEILHSLGFSAQLRTNQVVYFFEQARKLHWQNSCGSTQFMYDMKKLLDHTAGVNTVSKMPPGYI